MIIWETERKRGWQPDALAVMRKAMDTPFQWGVHDCALFVAEMTDAQMGTKIAATIRDQFADRQGATAFLRQHGHDGLVAMIQSYLGKPIPILRARRGSIVAINDDGRWCCGVVWRQGTAHYLKEEGLVVLPLTAAELAWRVGR